MEQIQRLMQQAGRLYQEGRYEQALPVAREACDLARRRAGAQHPLFAASLNNLAGLYRAMGEHAAALPLARQALEATRAALGEAHPNFAISLDNLALLYQAMGDHAAALPLARQALEVRRAALGEAHPSFATSLNNLAELYQAMGDHAAALPLCRQALQVTRAAQGESHPEVAHLLNRLAMLLQARGDHDAAEPLLRQALATARDLGEKHLVGGCLNNLAMLCHARQDYEAAERLYREALEIARDTLGEKHPEVARSLNNLAALARARGDAAAAESLMCQALEVTQTGGGTSVELFTYLNHLAMLHEERGDWVAAEPLLRQALEVGRPTLGERHGAVADCLGRLAMLYVKHGDVRGEPLVRQVLALLRAELGERHPGVGAWLNNLGGLYMERGDYAFAEAHYRQGLEIARAAGDEGRFAVGSCLNNLAILYQDRGDSPRAETLARESLEVRLQSLGDDHPDVAMSRHTLAVCYGATGDFTRAEPLARQAFEVVRRVLGESHPHYLDCAQLLGEILAARGDHVAAEPLLREVAERIRPGQGGGGWVYVDNLRRLVKSYLPRENYAAAVPLAEQVLALPELPGNENPLRRIEDLKNLASAYEGVGRWAEAEPLVRQALRITRQEFGEEHPDYLSRLCELAHLHGEMHNHASAETLLRKALNISRRKEGEWGRFTLKCAHDLGCLYLSMGYDSAADSLFRQVLQAARQGADVSPGDRAAVLSSLGAIARHARQWAEAEEFHRKAYELGETALRRESLGFASVAQNFALALATLGRHTEAEPLYQEALRIIQKRAGETHPNYATTASCLGKLYAALGRPGEALALFLQVEALNDRLLGAAVSFGSERQLASYLRSSGARHNWAVVVSLVLRDLANSPGAKSAAFDLVLRRKAVWAESQMTRREAVLSGQYPSLEPQLHELAELRSRIAGYTLAGPGPGGPARQQQLLDQWNAAKDRLEGELARFIPEVELTRRLQSADRDAVARALPEGSILVEFIRLAVHDCHAVPARGEPEVLAPRYVAFVLAAGDPDNVRLVDLGEADAIDRMIAEFRASIRGDTERGRVRNLTLLEDTTAPFPPVAGLALRAAVFDPLIAALAGRDRLLLAPDGDLTRLPFEVLPTEGGGWVLDAYQISYVSTGRDVLRFQTAPLADARAPEVFADPDFDLGQIEQQVPGDTGGQPASSSLPSIQWAPSPAGRALRLAGSQAGRDLRQMKVRFPRLPGSRVEAGRVGRLLGVTPWLGREACKGRLRACRSPQVLHIATHGFFLEDCKLARRQGDMDWQGGTPAGRLLDTEAADPLLRSGLSLAGANTWLEGGSPPAEAEDGVLTAEDVISLDLRGTELVVLSACETGLGTIRVGEGVVGLRHAFTVAGARTLVMSLWKVPDEQTQELMVDFYTRILHGKPRAEALREAQQSLRARYPNPYYWGAFVLQGQTGALVGASTPAVSRD
jgi:tetratricopeptide (TPR) repeat protein/CHAT domain-containing protein